MVRYRRNFVPGGTYFFTVTLADRTSSAMVHHMSVLRMAFRIARHERPFTIEAIVILPEHLHAIWRLPSDDSDSSGRWKRIKAYLTHRLVATGVPVKRHRNGEYALWQRRFWEHTIRNEIDFERHVDYVHFNPVKHKLVSWALEWPYSSFHVYVRRGLLPADWAGDVGEPTIDFGERMG
jgi:putative transposase